MLFYTHPEYAALLKSPYTTSGYSSRWGQCLSSLCKAGFNDFNHIFNCGGSPDMAYGEMLQFSSFHEGSACFTFTDGSARFLSENMDSGVYMALLTRANNELIDDEDF